MTDTVQATLQTSADGGTTWTDVQTFTFGTGTKLSTNVSAWASIPSNGCARILGGGGTAAAIVDNIFIALPSSPRTLDFDDITVTNGLYLYNYTSYSCQGWTITDTAISIYVNVVWSGNSGLVRNGMIASPRMDNIGSISFMYRMGTFTGDDNARLKVEVSPDNKNWTTITASLAGTSEWQSYDYCLGESADYHYVRISQTTSGKRMLIDDISLNDFVPAPSVALVSSLDPPHPVTNEMFCLTATAYPRNSADVLSVTGYVKYASGGRWSPLPMTDQGAGIWVSETQPGHSDGVCIISCASVWYGGIGAVPGNPGYAVTNLSTLASTVTVSRIRFSDVSINQLFAGRFGDKRDTHSVQLQRVRQNMDATPTAFRSVGGITYDFSLPLTTPSLVNKAKASAAASTDTPPFRVDARAARGEALVAREVEWALWDTAWIEGAARVEVTLERPRGAVETLGGAEGSKAHGSVEWTPGENEWGMFTLRLASWDADGEPLDELLALRIRRVPAELAYAEWIAARGGSPETMPMDADTDTDGASNWEEYVADTDPLNPEEIFASRLDVLEDGTLRVIPSVVSTGRIYRARLHGDLLQDAVWQELGPGRPGIGGVLGGETGQMGFGAVGVSLP